MFIRNIYILLESIVFLRNLDKLRSFRFQKTWQGHFQSIYEEKNKDSVKVKCTEWVWQTTACPRHTCVWQYTVCIQESGSKNDMQMFLRRVQWLTVEESRNVIPVGVGQFVTVSN